MSVVLRASSLASFLMGQSGSNMKQTRSREHLDVNSNIILSKSGGKRFLNESETNTEIFIVSPVKRTKKEHAKVFDKEIRAFFRLLEDPVIYEFLCMDACLRISDKYLLAMVFTYFKRAKFEVREYNRTNFFLSLYLANDIEEDEEDYKFEIFPWALGHQWRKRYDKFIVKREKLWKKMDYRAVVSRSCCEEVMNLCPDHWAWKRNRPKHHAGALRNYMRDCDEYDLYPRGPDSSPRHCDDCATMHCFDYGSPTSWYLSSSSDSSPGSVLQVRPDTHSVRVVSNYRFNLEGLRETLKEEDTDGDIDEEIWAHKEE